jgi:hypothetical protein
MFLIFMILVAALTFAVIYVIGAVVRRLLPASRRARIALFTIVGVVLATAAFILPFLNREQPLYFGLWSATLVLALVVWAVVGGPPARLVVPLAGIGTLMILFCTPVVVARQDVRSLQETGDAVSQLVAGIPLFPWHAEAAIVHWRTEQPPGLWEDGESCVIYLGESDGQSLVYLPGENGYRRLLRLSDDEALVEVILQGACVGWPAQEPQETR